MIPLQLSSGVMQPHTSPRNMIPDIRFEADFLRTALLLGMVRERDVRNWADALLTTDAEPIPLLADIALAPPELTALREALLPLATPSQHESLGAALLAFLATDPGAIALATSDRLRVLAQLRREDILVLPLAEAIKAFEDRLMLASAGIGFDPAIPSDLSRWLGSVHGARYYRISLGHADERAALLGALSRRVVRDRRAMTSPLGASQAWLVEATSGHSPALVVNAALWQIAVAEFSPLPLASRIPYATIPANAVLLLDEATAESMGAREAGDRLAAV